MIRVGRGFFAGWTHSDPLAWPDSLRWLLAVLPGLGLAAVWWLSNADLIQRQQQLQARAAELAVRLAERPGPIRDWHPFDTLLAQHLGQLDARLARLDRNDSLAERLAALSGTADRAGVELLSAQPLEPVQGSWPPARDLRFRASGPFPALYRFALAASDPSRHLVLIPESLGIDGDRLVLEATARSYQRPEPVASGPLEPAGRRPPPPWLTAVASAPPAIDPAKRPASDVFRPPAGPALADPDDPFRLPGRQPIQSMAAADAAHPLQAHALAELRLVALLFQGSTGLALIETPDRRLHRVDTGQQLGTERATVVAITPVGLQLRHAGHGASRRPGQWLRVEVQP